jgi:hypothetical protein
LPDDHMHTEEEMCLAYCMVDTLFVPLISVMSNNINPLVMWWCTSEEVLTENIGCIPSARTKAQVHTLFGKNLTSLQNFKSVY